MEKQENKIFKINLPVSDREDRERTIKEVKQLEIDLDRGFAKCQEFNTRKIMIDAKYHLHRLYITNYLKNKGCVAVDINPKFIDHKLVIYWCKEEDFKSYTIDLRKDNVENK